MNEEPKPPQTTPRSEAERLNGDISVPAQWRNTIKVDINGKKEDCLITVNTISGSLARVMLPSKR